MSVAIPLGDECEYAPLKVGNVGEVRSGKALSLEDGEPLLYLIHPGAMHGCKLHAISGMPFKPSAYALAFVDTDVVAHDYDVRHLIGRLQVDGFDKLDELDLTLSCSQDPDDVPRLNVECDNNLCGALTLVFVLHVNRYTIGLCRAVRS